MAQTIRIRAGESCGQYKCVLQLPFSEVKTKDTLTHHHVLQDMAMDHPNTRLRNTDSPDPPSAVNARTHDICVLVEQFRVSRHKVVSKSVDLGFVRLSIISTVATTRVVIVLSVGVERVCIHGATVRHQ